jgi:hypothetical protein
VTFFDQVWCADVSPAIIAPCCALLLRGWWSSVCSGSPH